MAAGSGADGVFGPRVSAGPVSGAARAVIRARSSVNRSGQSWHRSSGVTAAPRRRAASQRDSNSLTDGVGMAGVRRVVSG
jgi:hypothetical protein